MVWPHVFAGQCQVAQNGGQQVVEIVRHTTGQRANGLHLLRLAQLRLQRALLRFGLFQFGDVAVGADHAQRLTVVVAGDHHAAREHPFPGTVFALDAVLVAVDRRFASEMGGSVAQHLGQVVWVGAAVERLSQIADFVFSKTEHRLDARRVMLFSGVQVPVPHAITGALHRQPPAGFAFAQRQLGALAFGDVKQHTHAHLQRRFLAHGA